MTFSLTPSGERERCSCWIFSCRAYRETLEKRWGANLVSYVNNTANPRIVQTIAFTNSSHVICTTFNRIYYWCLVPERPLETCCGRPGENILLFYLSLDILVSMRSTTSEPAAAARCFMVCPLTVWFIRSNISLSKCSMIFDKAYHTITQARYRPMV